MTLTPVPPSVTKGIYQVGGSNYSDGKDASVFLVDVGEGNSVMIDSGAGEGVDAIFDNMMLCSLEPAGLHTLILTHCHIDHIGGASRIKEETGCKIIAHELDSDVIENGNDRATAAGWYGIDYIPIKVDIRISGEKEKIQIGTMEFTFLHTPGHTPGSMVVVIDTQEGKVLFGQDIHGPFDPDFGSDISKWRHSMEMLMELDADILCEGHFGTYRPKKKVREYIQGYLSRYR